MALTVGELQVQLEARTAEFRRGLRAAEGRLARFDRTAGTRVASVQKRFIGLGTAITGVVGILAGLAITRGLVNFAKQSIDTAAQFERFEIQLQNFVGSQEAAADAVERFTVLAARTPFAVSDVVSAGTQLGAVALGNVDALERLTQTAINLAAVTGIGLRETASNLQRSLTAGIASADLFRERGVRQLIEAVTGIPDITAVPLKRQAELFDEAFGPEGVFGQAAENLSFTLGGAISNVGDAFERLQATVGAAFAPATIAGLREFLIPLLDRLRILVGESGEGLLDFSFNAIRAAVSGFGFMVDAIRFVIDAIGTLNQLLLDARSGFASFNADIGLLLATAGIISAETLGTLNEVAGDFNREAAAGSESLEALSRGAAAVVEEIDKLAKSFDEIDIRKFAADQKEATELSEKAAASIAAAAAATKIGAAESKAQVKTLETIRKLEAKRNLERLRAFDTRLAERQVIEDQIQALRELNVAEADRARLTALIAALRRDQEAIFDADAIDIPSVAETFSGALSEGFSRFSDEGFGGFTTSLGDALFDRAEDALTQAFESSLETFEASFQRILDGLAGNISDLFKEDGALSGLGKRLGGVLGNETFIAGLVGVGGKLLSGLTASDEFESAAANVASAVTSAQQVRGVVAGPTTIAVGEVFRSIQEANTELERIGRVQIGQLGAIEANTRTTSTGGAAETSAVEVDLATESESLI